MSPRSRRELTVAVLLCLLGAFVVLVGAGNAWTRVDLLAGAVTDARTVGLEGTELAPGVRALGLVGLAGVVALAATRRTGRLVVGLLLVATGAGVVATVLGTDTTGPTLASDQVRGAGGEVAGDVTTTVWPAVTVLGAALLVLAGLLVAARGRSWAALSTRYDAPAVREGRVEAAPEPGQAEARAQRALWESLDRGEDPTGR